MLKREHKPFPFAFGVASASPPPPYGAAVEMGISPLVFVFLFEIKTWSLVSLAIGRALYVPFLLCCVGRRLSGQPREQVAPTRVGHVFLSVIVVIERSNHRPGEVAF